MIELTIRPKHNFERLRDYCKQLAEGLQTPSDKSSYQRALTLAMHVCTTRAYFDDEDTATIFDEVLKALEWSRDNLIDVAILAEAIGSFKDESEQEPAAS